MFFGKDLGLEEVGRVLEEAAAVPAAKPVEVRKYPTEMSCVQAFDLLVGCMGVSGQIRSYYRYGQTADCGFYLDKFKFCVMSLGYGEEREARVAEWYEKKWGERLAKGSSEDVWVER